MKELIKVLDEWLLENKYTDLEGKDKFETLYTHCLKSGGAFLDAQLWWRCVKHPLGKTGYLRYRINIEMHYLGDPSEIDYVHKGKKVKMNKAELSVFITPFVELDFANKWKEEGLMGLITDVFRKKIYKKDIDDHVTLLYIEANKLQNMIKQFFGLESVYAVETVSQPPKGLMP